MYADTSHCSPHPIGGPFRSVTSDSRKAVWRELSLLQERTVTATKYLQTFAIPGTPDSRGAIFSRGDEALAIGRERDAHEPDVMPAGLDQATAVAGGPKNANESAPAVAVRRPSDENAMQARPCVCPAKTCATVAAFPSLRQITPLPSSEAVATVSLPGPTTAQVTGNSWPRNEQSSFPDPTLHNFATHDDAVTTMVPSGEKATEVTKTLCWKECSAAWVFRVSHSLTTPPDPAVSKRKCFGQLPTSISA
eukprot:CAMPEP_0117538728 /NCGR_PEP_ID=MMETSP0784-20121206/42627_1 /TAXON_ID=39447 /ORGANISM="" /LENGTH=249 /DNA_ID=CAMNT_0005335349 /DNA_START=344 /DNA_END=1095 /DNA_ORIENTATION=+